MLHTLLALILPLTYSLNEKSLPLVLEPSDSTLDEICEQFETEREDWHALLKEHGALLFRNCSVENADDYYQFILSFYGQEPINYIAGDGSRVKVREGVYTSTEAPSSFFIPLHNELSCTDSPLSYINFFCDVAPSSGTGRTVLGFTREVTNRIMNDFGAIWKKFDGKTLRYVSRHPKYPNFYTKINPSHKTWQESFETTEPKEVEAICEEKNFTFTWRGDWLEVERLAPATRSFSDGEKSWYNQAHLYHRNAKIRGSSLNHILAELVYCREKTMPYDVTFEDGTAIPFEWLSPVYDVLKESMVEFDWQKGDVLLIDNFEVMHGKSPHKGPRLILTTLMK